MRLRGVVSGWFVLLPVIAAVLFGGCGGAAQKDESELEVESVDKAMKLAQSGDPGRAIEMLEDVLDVNNSLARVHLELGMLLHESRQDYIGALYHYRKYMLLRPDSEKRYMIEERIRTAMQLLGAGVTGLDKKAEKRIEELEKENERLHVKIGRMEAKLAEVRDAGRDASASRTAVADSAGGAGGAGSAAGKGNVIQDGGFSRYTVQVGDSLSNIALKVYKDAAKWERIYEANRKELESSNALKVGQVLVIP